MSFEIDLILKSKCPEEHIIAILKDVPRTFSDEDKYRIAKPDIEKSSLFKILIAYANTDTDIGYTQGN